MRIQNGIPYKRVLSYSRVPYFGDFLVSLVQINHFNQLLFSWKIVYFIKVKPDYYKTIVALKSLYHCTDAQAVGSIVLTGQNLFHLPWKFFNEDSDTIDLDTAPCSSNNRREARIHELFSLAAIVDKIMGTDEKSTISYHDDGSRTQGTGAFSVQGISINRQYYALPTLSIAKETRSNLVELKVCLLI